MLTLIGQKLCFYNCLEDMEISRHYTPSHMPSWTVWRIYALVKNTISTGYFIKETKKKCSVFPYVIETVVEVWKNSK